MVDTPDYDEQDVAEVFDEDNTNEDEARTPNREDAEQFEDIPDVYDVTSRVGDRHDEEAEIGEEMDDDEIVQSATDNDDDDDDIEDDDLKARHGEGYGAQDPADENDLGPDDPDLVDGIDEEEPDEVELTYAGDLNDVEGAEGSAADMESEGELSDDDLRELDYKD
jgi:hypothetical protein